MRRQRLTWECLIATSFLAAASSGWEETPVQPHRNQQAVQAKSEALGLPTKVDEPAKVLKQGPPKYPREAKSRCQEGTVLLMVVIDSRGLVAEAVVLEPQPGLDDAAIKCVKEWRFRPARKAGQAVGVVGLVPVIFRVDDLKCEARKAENATGQETSALSFDPQGADFTLWVNRFKDEVYRNWIIPHEALFAASRRNADFEFTVERDGSLSSLRLLKSSGTPSLDTAAQSALMASHLMTLPSDYPAARATMQITFLYNRPSEK